MNLISFLWKILILMSVFSCDNHKIDRNKMFLSNSSANEYIALDTTNSLIQKDKIQILATVRQFIDANYSFFHIWHNREDFNEIEVNVDEIFYSPDSMKLMCFVYVIYKPKEATLSPSDSSKDVKSRYMSFTLVGYRDQKNVEQVKIFDLDEIFIGSGIGDISTARNSHRGVWINLNELNRRSIMVWDEQNNKYSFERISYLPKQAQFWSETPIWKKGNRCPEYYSFEVTKNSKPTSCQLRGLFR